MKRIFVIFLCLMLLLAGCGPQAEDAVPTITEPAATASTVPQGCYLPESDVEQRTGGAGTEPYGDWGQQGLGGDGLLPGFQLFKENALMCGVLVDHKKSVINLNKHICIERLTDDVVLGNV